MQFCHANEIWRDFPELAAGVVVADGIAKDAVVEPRISRFEAIAGARLASRSEAELPEIQAWRRAFSKMGLKPTQYRSAPESLLRRFRQEKALPRIHPLIDLCNSISLAFAIPVAAFDRSRIAGNLEVRYASGSESYLAFSGQLEQPEPREVIFADDAGRAHARRWTNRQSAWSAIRDETSEVLIVAEALHDTAAADVAKLIATIAGELDAVWSAGARTAMLSGASPRFDI